MLHHIEGSEYGEFDRCAARIKAKTFVNQS